MSYFAEHKKPEETHQQAFYQPVPTAAEAAEEEYLEDYDGYVPQTYEEEQAMARQDRWRVAANIADFFAVLAGIVTILMLVAVLISLVNWVAEDMTQSFTLLQAWM